MEVTCDSCQSKFRIPDDKVPVGKVATLPCPKCKNKITVDNRKKSEDAAESDSYDASDKPFDFVEEEAKTALICEPDNNILNKMSAVLTNMEYHITRGESTRDVLKKMRYHIYDVILVDENFDAESPDSNGVLLYLERLDMSIRRNIFVVMISHRYRTMDNLQAFNKSVNMVINPKNIDDFDKILKRGMTENDLFYRVYKETLRTLGRV
ncbi:MAG: zinc-ribbon domain-containing protein [Desulfobacterales bacterium]|nr:zinc-ribbon domain-containing protein [Desulfobacterales bacterium]MBF0396103.1 zinc-ribbon domain-containing protein [Desulfobacterales bacterium]